MKRFILFLMLAAVSVFPQQSAVKLFGDSGKMFISPLYSPDGTMAAFTSENYKGLWIYNFADNSLRQITDEAAAGFGFSWSQDSKSILTRVAKYQGLNRLNAVKIFDVQTGETVNLSGYQAFMPVLPQWSDGGTQVITYTKKLESYPTGKTAKQGTLSRSAIIVNNKVAVSEAAGSDLKMYEPVEGDYLNLSLSPDGSKIVFQVSGRSMYVINSDGTGFVNLGRGERPRWSPDSRKISFMISEDDGHYITGSDIYIINADGSGRERLTDTPANLEMNPSFSPDGRNIIYDDTAEGGIFIMKID